MKRLFTAIERGQAGSLKPLGVLADFVEVEAAHEKAAEEFLHDELEYVVVRDWTQAEIGINVMRMDLDGRATFLVHPEPGAQVAQMPVPEPPIGPATGILARLSDVLRMTNGLTQAPAALLPRLARCFLAEDRQTAQQLALQYPDYYFLVGDGVCYHGHAVSGGRKTGGGPLGLKRELRELTGLWAVKQRELEESTRSLETLEREIHGLGEGLERIRGLQQAQEKEALALDHEMRKLAEEQVRVNQRLSVARLESRRIEQETVRSREQQEESRLLAEEKEQARLAEEEALAAWRAELDGLQAKERQLAEEHSALRVQLAEREERRRAERLAQARLEAQAEEVAGRCKEVVAELGRLGQERVRLLACNLELDELNRRLAGEIAAVEDEVARLAQEEEALRGSLAVAEEELRQLRAGLQAVQEARSQIEVALVEKRAALRYLDETCQKELNAPVARVAESAEAVPDEAGLAEAEEKCNTLKARIEALGPVNPQALEEYE